MSVTPTPSEIDLAVPETRAARAPSAALLVGLALLVSAFLDPSDTLRAALIGFAALLLLWRPAACISRERWVALAATAALLLGAGVRDDVGRLLEGKVRVWNVYHYYLGAKYFTELGYHDLYLATLHADREGPAIWEDQVDKVRNLATYEVVRTEELLPLYDPKEHFSEARWSQFKRDVRDLSRHRSPKGWRNVFRDRGYNGTPLWTAVWGSVASATPARGPAIQALALLDLGLLLATAFVFAKTFGPRLSLLVLLLFVASPANVPRLVGGFLQTDWLCAIVLGVCFLRQRRFGGAGAALAYATMTRVFPILFVSFLFVPIAWGLLRGVKLPAWTWRLLASFFGTCAFLFLLGLANGRGLRGWAEFSETILVHRDLHTLGDRRIGLEHVFTSRLDDFGDRVRKSKRAEVLESQRAGYRWASAGLLFLIGLAAVGSRGWRVTLLAIPALFALTVVSRYYFGIAALLPLLPRSDPGRRMVVLSQLAGFGVHALLVDRGAGWHESYVQLNLLLALHLLVTLGVVLAERHRLRKPVT